MSKYGVDRCTECGTVSELLLSPRFPHICSRCLFTPPKPEDSQADLSVWTPADTLMGRLANRAPLGVFRGFLDAYGKKLPESYNRKPWE